MDNSNRIHPFERVGLGKAPFRFSHQYRAVFQAIPGDPSCPILPGASCDYCGQGIYEVYVIQSADKRTFKVGCDCVAKVSKEAATTEAEKLAAAVDAARRKANRSKAHVKAAAVKAELKALLTDEDVCRQLMNTPHPTPARAERGERMLGFAQWMATHAGASGHAKALKLVRAALAEMKEVG